MMVSNYVSSSRPDLPAIFESLNDDTLTTVLEFVGNKSYRSFGGLNYHCKEIYLSSGMTKETFLYGYAPLSVITDRIERVGYDRDLFESVGKGVVYYDRRDVFEWAVEEQNTYLLKGICHVATEEGKTYLLDEFWNNVNDEEDKRYIIFGEAIEYAARFGKLNVIKWLETKGFASSKIVCSFVAAKHGQLHILKWLREEQGLELFGTLYDEALEGAHLHVMKWLREQNVDWTEGTFYDAAKYGNLNILQWLHDEGCPWDEDDCVHEEYLEPEVINWLRVNGYGDRIDSYSDNDY